MERGSLARADSRFPLLLAELGFLPADLARAAGAGEDPVDFALRYLSSRGRIDEALAALDRSELPRDAADRMGHWCRRAESYAGETDPGISLESLAPSPSTKKETGPAAGAATRDTTAPRPSGSSPAEAGEADFPALLPDRYEFRKLLGRGGMGAVYEVFDRELGRAVALKALGKRSDGAVRRFVAEARATALLEHPGILPCYTVDVDRGGGLYYTMMKVEGRSLAEALPEISLETALRALVQAARAVAHAHSRGIVHRDLKPANVMLGEHGEAWVVDWGLVALGSGGPEPEEEGDAWAHGRLTVTGAMLGTPGYMAPEQLDAGSLPVGPAADVHGLGAILYEILSGARPYPARTKTEFLRRMAAGPPAPPGPQAPPALAAIAMKALARVPEERYGTAGEFADDVAAFLARAPVSVYRSPLPLAIVAWVRKRPVASAAVAVLALLSAGLGAAAAVRTALEAQALRSVAEEGEKERLALRERSELGLEKSLADSRSAHEERLARLAEYALPFEKVYTEPRSSQEAEEQARKLASLDPLVFRPSNDPAVARACDAWEAAVAEARSHLETLGSSFARETGRECDTRLDREELEWAFAEALATERATFRSRQVEEARRTSGAGDPPPAWSHACELARAMAGPGALGPDDPAIASARELLAARGRLAVGPLPLGATGVLVEYQTGENPFGREVVREGISSEGVSIELPIGSYALEVSRGGRAFVFPALVERCGDSRIEVALPEDLPGGFVWIPPGSYLAGGQGQDAWPRHRRVLSRGFLIGEAPVTSIEYAAFLADARPAARWEIPAGHPAYFVSRDDAGAYLAWKSAKDPLYDYRLPSEEEWARAASGADGRAFVWGDRFQDGLADAAGHAGVQPAGVSPFDRSVFGVLDLAGNLRDWTSSGAPGGNAVVRGGDWTLSEDDARIEFRDVSLGPQDRVNYVGFRVVAVRR
ncbi:MAG: SUMF1/EgtB/PvdO family nonheme iron enzyme [Planctomycetes bacterium]|nr:SUMF1/EgtB/PvdO family nonheme iron enzyme [Planctomycetota bacterium]